MSRNPVAHLRRHRVGRLSPVRSAAYSLLETVVVLAVIAILSGGSLLLYQNYREQQRAVSIVAALEQIATAQVAFLQDKPYLGTFAITAELLLPYLPGNAMPAALNGVVVNVTVNPPTGQLNGQTYTARTY